MEKHFGPDPRLPAPGDEFSYEPSKAATTDSRRATAPKHWPLLLADVAGEMAD
jgi:hypothetical protein